MFSRISHGGAALLAGLIVAGCLAGGAAAASAISSCSGQIGAITITGDLVAGPGCKLQGTTVTGDVSVAAGGTLDTSNAVIGGNLLSVGGTHVYVSGGSISADVVIRDMPVVPAAAYAVLLSGTHIGGNVTLQHDAFYLGVYGSYIGGDLLVTGNTGGYSDARLGDVEILRNTVLGNVFVTQNAASGSLIDVFYVSGNTVTQSIEVGNNTAIGGRQLDYVTVNFNAAGGDILVHDNTVVGGEPMTPAYVWVGDNVVAATLSCYSNTPQPVGVPNVAALKLGQCASL